MVIENGKEKSCPSRPTHTDQVFENFSVMNIEWLSLQPLSTQLWPKINVRSSCVNLTWLGLILFKKYYGLLAPSVAGEKQMPSEQIQQQCYNTSVREIVHLPSSSLRLTSRFFDCHVRAGHESTQYEPKTVSESLPLLIRK